MKSIILAAVLIVCISAPAHAFSIKKAVKHITMRRVLGAPFFAVGFTVALAGDVITTPFKMGAQQYIYGDPIKGW